MLCITHLLWVVNIVQGNVGDEVAEIDRQRRIDFEAIIRDKTNVLLNRQHALKEGEQ